MLWEERKLEHVLLSEQQLQEFIDGMKLKGMSFEEKGITKEEVSLLEKELGLVFPPIYKQFIQAALPTWSLASKALQSLNVNGNITEDIKEKFNVPVAFETEEYEDWICTYMDQIKPAWGWDDIPEDYQTNKKKAWDYLSEKWRQQKVIRLTEVKLGYLIASSIPGLPVLSFGFHMDDVPIVSSDFVSHMCEVKGIPPVRSELPSDGFHPSDIPFWGIFL
eukprot:Pgem_evm2s9358